MRTAQAALDACTWRIRFQSIPSEAFTALLELHPRTPEQPSTHQWDPVTFQPALVAACAVDSDLTEQEWAAELGSERWSTGERNALFMQALAVNISS